MTKRRKSARSTSAPNGIPVAVVGIGCRFPNAYGPQDFWQFLSRGDDAITEVPVSRYDIDTYHDPRPRTPNRIVSRLGGFLDQIDEFDAGYFGVAPREAERMDPQQRLLLETTAEAIDDAGLTRERLSELRTGVYVGGMSSAYSEMLTGAGIMDLYALGGGARSFMSGRLSYALDLRGPSMVVDTACSSSLSAVHLARQSLRTGESTVAIAGGVNVILSPKEAIAYSQAAMLAPDGHCKFGDANADGFVRSEGVGVVVLKRLAHALRDGNPILALMLGSAVTNDGTRQRAAADQPSRSGRGHARDAYATPASTPPSSTTSRRTERAPRSATTSSCGRSPRDRPRGPRVATAAVGSVKGNIGHTEAAAGIAGLIKAVLALQHDGAARLAHLRLTRASTGTAQLPLEAVTATGRGDGRTADPGRRQLLRPVRNQRPCGGRRLHAGTDARAVPGATTRRRPSSSCSRARSRRLTEVTGPRTPSSSGRTAPVRPTRWRGLRRPRRAARRAPVPALGGGRLRRRPWPPSSSASPRAVRSAADGGPGAPVFGGPRRTVFVFPGQGSQWIGMGRELLGRSDAFRQAMAACDQAVREEAGLVPAGTAQRGGPGAPRSHRPGAAAALGAGGVDRRDLAGHGGRTGRLRRSQHGRGGRRLRARRAGRRGRAAVICRRSRLLRRVAGQGAMALVELSAADAEAALAGDEDCVVAVRTAPRSTVLAGDPDALGRVSELTARRLLPAGQGGRGLAQPADGPLARRPAAGLGDLRPSTPASRCSPPWMPRPRRSRAGRRVLGGQPAPAGALRRRRDRLLAEQAATSSWKSAPTRSC